MTLKVLRPSGIRRRVSRRAGRGRPLADNRSVGSTEGRESGGGTMVNAVDGVNAVGATTRCYIAYDT